MLENNRFYLSLIRHGESVFNTTPDRIGQEADTPLTAKGNMQANLLRKRFEEHNIKFDYVFTSDYLRAYDTCKTSLDGVDHGPIAICQELREYSAGDWNGLDRHDIHTPEVLLKMSMLNSAFCPPNGESMHMVERRASKWLEDAILYNKDIIKEAQRREVSKMKPMEIAVFSHGMTIKCLLHYIMGFDQSFIWRLTLENTSITKLYFDDKGWRLLTVNDFAHLL